MWNIPSLTLHPGRSVLVVLPVNVLSMGRIEIFNHCLYLKPLKSCPVSRGCRIHRLLLCRGVRPPSNECPGYDTKQSDGEVLAMLELWGMRSNPSLLSLPGPLWPGVVAPDKYIITAKPLDHIPHLLFFISLLRYSVLIFLDSTSSILHFSKLSFNSQKSSQYNNSLKSIFVFFLLKNWLVITSNFIG